MRKQHEVFAAARVASTYDEVRETWLDDPLGILQRATATCLSGLFGAKLRVPVGPLEVSGDIVVDIVAIESGRAQNDEPATKLVIEWGAMSAPDLFPIMRATMTISPRTQGDTQLELHGTYEPPLGVVGEAADVVMRKFAQQSVALFVEDVARHLSRSVGERGHRAHAQ